MGITDDPMKEVKKTQGTDTTKDTIGTVNQDTKSIGYYLD